MQFGVTYYPDQWPRDTWDKEFQEIKKTGFQVVRFAEMAWDWIEPKEDVFKFEELDHALSLCEKYGLKVLLGVPVAQAPQWLIKKHPEVAYVANDGYIHPIIGPRPNACRDNKIFKKYSQRLTQKMAKRYSKHPAILMWQIDNEPTYPPLDLTHNKDYCHCTATLKAFTAWAKRKYKNLKDLNDAWGDKFWAETLSSFDEITTPKAGFWDAGNPHIYLDWFRFKSEQLSLWLKDLKRIIRKYDKTHKIGTNNFTSIVNRIPDHRIIAEDMDWFGWDIYPKGTQNSEESLSQIADYWKSICKATKSDFVVSELQGGPNVRWGYGGWVTGEEIKEWVRILCKHGAQTILFHNWKPPLFGSETGGFGILRPDGKPTERLEAIKEIIKEINGQIGGTDAINRVPLAIYYSRSSDIETYQEEGPQRPLPPNWFSGRGDLGLFFGNNSIVGAYRICYEKGIEPNFIFEKDLDADMGIDVRTRLIASLHQYKTILLTNPYLLSEKQFQNILEFVENGGTLISESRFGLKNEHAHLYQTPLLERLLGVEHLYTEIIGNPMKLKNSESLVTGFRDVINVKSENCTVIESYEDGTPALIEAKIGQGKVIYATFSLFSTVLKFENKEITGKIYNF